MVLPKVEDFGVTHLDAIMIQEKIPNNTIISFLFFDATSFSISQINLSNQSEDVIGATLQKDIHSISNGNAYSNSLPAQGYCGNPLNSKVGFPCLWRNGNH